jgi:hypothetical protein
MSEKDWDDIPVEELKSVATSLVYLKRAFGTDVGHPRVAAPEDGKGTAGPDTGKQGNDGASR